MTTIFAERIRNLRLKQGLSQDELAEAAGVSQNAISRYEHGANDPTSAVIVKLARVLNTSADYLLGMTDDQTPKMQEPDLSAKERKAIAAWRRGDTTEAIRTIVGNSS